MNTGFYMVSVAHVAVWSSGFVVAGLTGVTLLFASGTFLGIKGNALKQMLERIAANGADQPAPKLVPPPLVAELPLINTGIALGVVFDMVAKPASVAGALAVIAAGQRLALCWDVVGLRPCQSPDQGKRCGTIRSVRTTMLPRRLRTERSSRESMGENSLIEKMNE